MTAVRSLMMVLLVLACASEAAQAATVRALVDRDRVMVGESISLQVIIDGGDGEVDLSGLTDFKTISRGTSSSFQMINGRTSRQLTHNYVIIPTKTGELTISAISVTIDGKVSYTRPIRVFVTEQPPADSGRRDVYVTAEVSETSPWRGQQFVYTFRLFNSVQVADAKFQAPEFTGFNAEQLEDQKTYRKVINGREFMVSEVVIVLVPVKSGVLTIEPAVLQVGVVQRGRQPGPFSGMDAFFGRRETTTRILETKPIEIRVRDLPPPPGGTAFSGLVGRFELTATLDNAAIQEADSATLTVTIQGRGNIMDATAPVIPSPQSFKTYADNPEEEIQLGRKGYSGRKIFRTALVPVTAGQFTIDPIFLTYFDVETAEYRTLTTEALAIHVSPSDKDVTDAEVFRAAPTPSLNLKKSVEFTGRDILPLKTDLAAIESIHTMRPLWFALLMALPVLIFAAAMVLTKFSRKDDRPEKIMGDRAKQALKAATGSGATDGDFLSALHRALVSAICSRQGAMGASLTWAEARDRLSDLGWREEDAADTARLLETIESFNYSGETLDENKRADLLDRTRRAVRQLIR